MESATSSTTPNKKPHKNQKANEGEDIISSLPESLISCILSFLPTRDAVRTCVLSKRWIHCWTSITKVDINDNEFYSPNKRQIDGEHHFVNFVDMVLLRTKDSSVESFSLRTKDYKGVIPDAWISSILSRRIKKLRIVTSPSRYVDIPSHSLFNCISLEELVLHLWSHIKVPTIDVCFRHLRFLKLSLVVFTNTSSGDCLSLNLPVLKVFETNGCIWLNTKVVTVKAPLLERVELSQYNFMLSCLSLLERNQLFSCPIKFSDCHLKEFTYWWGYGISEPFILSNTSSAHNASVTMGVYEGKDQEPGFNAFKLLNQFSQVKCIRFHASRVLTQQDVDILPVFEMLSYLELDFATGEGLLGLLQKTPFLKTLVFKGISKFNKGLLNFAVVPNCLASTLKIVDFEKVNGYEHELYLAKVFIESGLVLERMSFSIAAGVNGKSKVMEEFKEKIFSFKKGSSFALVEFSCN